MSRLAEELLPYDAWCMVFGYLQPTEVSRVLFALGQSRALSAVCQPARGLLDLMRCCWIRAAAWC